MSLAATMIILIIQIFACFLSITANASSPQGFTIDLVHRRSNSSSSSRMSKTQNGSPYAETVFETTEYLMKLQIGTPPMELEGILDTGSDDVWVQCLPCGNCSQQAPAFDPSKSSTYKDKICDDTPDHSCPYQIIYGDQTYSKGIYATETVRIHSSSGQPFVMPETTIGCGHDNTALSSSESGIVGLGLGPSSLISQLGDNFKGRFSYCFAGKGTSKISFGANALVEGQGTISTTMFKKMNRNFYYLNLDAVTIGNSTRVETLGTPFHVLDGNTFLDSGSTYSYLPGSYCNLLKDAVENVVTLERTSFTGDLLCYNSNTREVFPEFTLHFSDGATLVLDKYNMWDDNGGSFCLAIICLGETEDAILGNRAQNNFLVGYDPSAQLVSFKHTNDCNYVRHDERTVFTYNNSASNARDPSMLWIWVLSSFLFVFFI